METNFDVNAAAAELQKYVNQYNREHSIADLTPTYCELFGIRKPATCAGTAIASVVDHAGHVMDGPGKAQKAVLFCADACGDVQSNYLKDLFPRVKAVAGLQVESVCVMPSVTPVCYGSIFTGTPPAVHGIRKYERPVLKVETLFDVMDKKEYIAIDTAGLRKKGKIYENVEKYSLLRAMKAIERSNVCVIVNPPLAV